MQGVFELGYFLLEALQSFSIFGCSLSSVELLCRSIKSVLVHALDTEMAAQSYVGPAFNIFFADEGVTSEVQNVVIIFTVCPDGTYHRHTRHVNLQVFIEVKKGVDLPVRGVRGYHFEFEDVSSTDVFMWISKALDTYAT